MTQADISLVAFEIGRFALGATGKKLEINFGNVGFYVLLHANSVSLSEVGWELQFFRDSVLVFECGLSQITRVRYHPQKSESGHWLTMAVNSTGNYIMDITVDVKEVEL